MNSLHDFELLHTELVDKSTEVAECIAQKVPHKVASAAR